MFGKKNKEKNVEETKPMQFVGDTQRKLDRATSKLAELNEDFKRVVGLWEPLEYRKNKLTGDIRYYQGRVEKLTKRLREGG